MADQASVTPATPVVVSGDIIKDRLEGLHAFGRMTQRWAELVDTSEPQAYGRLRRDLMDYSEIFISGQLMSAKEVLDKLDDLQQHIKKGGTGGLSVADEFHRWLTSKPEEES